MITCRAISRDRRAWAWLAGNDCSKAGKRFLKASASPIMPATWWARRATNTALSTWTVTPLGDRRVEPVAAAGSLVLVVAVVAGEPRPPATALRSDRWALMRSTTMNRARNTTSTAAARAVGPGRKLDLPGGVGTNANGEGATDPLEAQPVSLRSCCARRDYGMCDAGAVFRGAAATGRSGRGRRPTPPGRPAAGSVPGSSRQDGFPAHGGSPPPWRRRAATSDARRRGSRGHERAGHPGSPPSSSRPRYVLLRVRLHAVLRTRQPADPPKRPAPDMTMSPISSGQRHHNP